MTVEELTQHGQSFLAEEAVGRNWNAGNGETTVWGLGEIDGILQALMR